MPTVPPLRPYRDHVSSDDPGATHVGLCQAFAHDSMQIARPCPSLLPDYTLHTSIFRCRHGSDTCAGTSCASWAVSRVSFGRTSHPENYLISRTPGSVGASHGGCIGANSEAWPSAGLWMPSHGAEGLTDRRSRGKPPCNTYEWYSTKVDNDDEAQRFTSL